MGSFARLSRSFKYVGGHREIKLCRVFIPFRTYGGPDIVPYRMECLLIPGPKHRVTKNFKIAALSRMDYTALEAANICHLADMDIFELAQWVARFVHSFVFRRGGISKQR